MNKYLYIIFLTIVAPIFFAFSGVFVNQNVEAYYGKSAVSSKTYTFQRWLRADDIRTITTGSVDITHAFEMTKGGYTVNVGDEIDFSYTPTIFYYAYNGAWDTPYGGWCATINTRCTALSGYQVVDDGVGLTWWMSKPYAPYTYAQWYNIGVAENRWNRAQIGWTGVQPVGYITSSNANVISCSGRDCVATGSGVATLTAYGPATQTRIWTYVGFSDNTVFQWTSETMPYLNSVKTNIMTVPAKAVGSWVISVPPVCSLSFSPNPVTSPSTSNWTITSSAGVTTSDINCTGATQYEQYSSGPINGTWPFTGNVGDTVCEMTVESLGGSGTCGDTLTVSNAPVDGSCGSRDFQRHGTYTYAETSWPVGSNWCDTGTSVGNDFPDAGASSDWVCAGIDGGGDVTCTAERQGIPVNGSCGTRDSTVNRNYNYGETDWPVGYTLCSSGIEPGLVSFPAQPSPSLYNSTTSGWPCFGENGGVYDFCVATRLGPVCGNAVVEPTEDCDGGTYCDASCNDIPVDVCGNGVLEEVSNGEECEDGNTTDGDGCNFECIIEGDYGSVCPNGSCELGENFITCPVDCSADVIEF